MIIRTKKLLLSCLILCSTLYLCSCKAGNDSTEKINISGKTGSSYIISKSSGNKSGLLKDSSSSLKADTIVALPISTPFVASPEIMTGSVTAPINPDGSFTISVDTSRNWILLLVDSTKPRKEQIISFAALGDSTAEADTMILMPVSHAVSDIRLGTLEISGDEGVQTDSMSENLTSFSLNINDLREIALNDNLLKTLKNIYVNYDSSTGTFYSPLMVFWWDVDAKTAKNSYSNPANYTFSGYQPSFNSRNDTSFPYDGVKNHSFVVKIVPPESVTDTTNQPFSFFSNESTLTEENRGNGNWYVGSNNPPFGFSINAKGWIQMSASGCRFKNIVDGWWSIQKDAIEKAAFDLAVCSPINSTTNKPYVYLPSLKINVDASDNVTSFEIKWYIYNATSSSYEEVTDISGFANLMEWVGMNFNDNQSPGNNEICDFDSVTTTTVYPGKVWKFTGSSSGAYDISSIIIGYRIYGVDFDINLRP